MTSDLATKMTGRKAQVIALVLIAALGYLGVRYYPLNSSSMDGADFNDGELVALGEGVYKENCASCHGVDLEGQPDWRSRNPDGRLPAPPHDEEGHTWHHPDHLLFEITKFGPATFGGPDYQSDMPGYEDTLSDREIWASLAYIKSRWPAKIQQQQAMIDRKSRK